MQTRKPRSASYQKLPDGCNYVDCHDIWIRHIVENNFVRANFPRLKVSYIEKKIDFVEGRPWEAEISGRILSAALDVAGAAEAAATAMNKPGIKFRHVCFVPVRMVISQSGWGVVWEPKNTDVAHTNIVIDKVPMAPLLNELAAPKISQEFIRKIADVVQVRNKDDISVIDYMRDTRLSPVSAEAA